MRIDSLPYLLLVFFALLSREGLSETATRRGRIAGATHVYLRSGPGISHPAVAVLKSGEEVDVERQEGSWYHVSAADGKKGYIYQDFLSVVGSQPAEAPREDLVSEEKAQTAPAREGPPAHRSDKDRPEAPPQEIKASRPKPTVKPVPNEGEALPSQTKQEERWAPVRWAVVSLCIFILGWILGGNYYRRRDRIEKTKIRF